MSCRSATLLSFRGPRFPGNDGPRFVTAAAPTSLKERIMGMTFRASPQPVSPSMEGADHGHDVPRLPTAGVTVDQQGQPGGADDLGHEEAYFVHVIIPRSVMPMVSHRLPKR